MMTPEELQRTHEAGLRVLRETGVVFRHPETVDLFTRRGFSTDGTRVRFTRQQVEDALATIPSTFVLEGRSRQRDLALGGDGLVVTTAGGPATVVDASVTRPATDTDLDTSIRLGHLLPNVDMIGWPLEPQDIPASLRYPRAIEAAFTQTDKALEMGLSTPQDVRIALDMTGILLGEGWEQRTRMFAVVNTVSPLSFDEGACVGIVELSERNQAICVTPCAMGGTTAPATVAGVVAQQHAETLAGLVLAQLVRPGCPVVYGGFSSLASMVSGTPSSGYLSTGRPWWPPWSSPGPWACPCGPVRA